MIIPVYNEEEGLGDTLKDLKEVLGENNIEYELLVVDDGSTDNSTSIVSESDATLIKHPYNMGYGAAIKSGLSNAVFDKVLIIDGDRTYPCDEIPKLLEHSGSYDMVVGSRTGPKVKIELYRRPAKIFLNYLANYLSGMKIPDLNSGMRIFDRLKALRFNDIYPSGFSFTTTITLAFHSNDLTVKYVPINYDSRVGKSKISPINDGLNFILLIVKSIVYFKPLKVFIPVSLLLFFLSLFVFLYSYIILDKVMDISVIVILMSSIQIALFGLLADMLSKRK